MDQITILMAVYNQDKEWFKEQLSSLNQQTYPKVKLLICNDASPDISEKELEEFIDKYVDNIQWKLISNIENKGSTKTFERLTLEADGDYFAYCDQDDIVGIMNIDSILIQKLLMDHESTETGEKQNDNRRIKK